MQVLRPVTLSLSTLLLVACGGDSSDSAELTETTSFAGTMVVPQMLQQNSLRVMSDALLNSYSATCPNVPDGYEPMANAAISIEKADGSVLTQTTTTDSCGVFELSVDEDATGLADSVINASLAGYKPLKANANNFIKTNTTASTPVASTIPSSASYVISAIQNLGNNDISFSVIDSATNNAVIQLAKSSFAVSVNDQAIPITTVNSADQLNIASSNVMTIDASGSMGALISDDNSNPVLDSQGRQYDRFRITAKAAHQFVSEKANADEVAVIAFSSSVDLVKNALFIDRLNLQDSSSANLAYDYADDGFVIDKGKLHFAVDLYNPYSDLWPYKVDYDGRYADRTDLVATTGTNYLWENGTELEEAINTSVTEISSRTNTLKRVFVMTDGNSSFSDRSGVIELANNSNVVIHAIAVSALANEDDLTEIAAQTGGSYNKIIDEQNITGIYSALQTTVKYAYVATLGSPLQNGDSIKLSLTVNGETVERILTVQ